MKNKLLKLLITNLFVLAAMFIAIGQDFNSGLAGWTLDKSASTDVSDMFEHGNAPYTYYPWNKVGSSDLFIKTDLNGVYSVETHTWATSPVFDFSTAIQPKLKIEVYAEALAGSHGGYVMYSTDGSTWNLLGEQGQGTNWYDNSLHASLGGYDCWAFTNGWVNAEYPLGFLNGEATVQFKVAFKSDLTPAPLPGFGFDNFEIAETYQGLAAPMVVELTSPQSSPCALSAAETVVVDVKNCGTASLTAPWYIKYNVGASANSYEMVNTPLAAGATYSHSFGTTYDFSAAGTYTLTVSTSLDNSTDFSVFTADVETEALDEITTFPHFVDYSAPTPEFGYSTGMYADANIVAGEVVANGNGATGYLSDWVGGANSVTAQNAWVDNTEFISSGYTCNIDATSLGTLELIFDLYQEYAYSPDYNWFRVLVNGMPVADVDGIVNFVPDTYEAAAFKEVRFDLSAYAGTELNVEFQACTKYAGDIVKIDNFLLREKLQYDLAVTALAGPVTGCSLGMEQIVVEIENRGTSPATLFEVSYTVDGTTVTEQVPVVLAGYTYTHTFTSGTVDFSTGIVDVDLSINWFADQDAGNNMMTVSVENISNDLTNPYDQDFDGSENVVPNENWAVEDGNNDGSEWYWTYDHNGQPAYAFDYESASAMDYLFTNCFDLDATKSYKICLDIATYLAGADKGLQIYLSTTQDASGIVGTPILDLPTFNTYGNYYLGTEVFQVPSNGVYYIAIKALGAPTLEAEYLLIDNFRISEFEYPDMEITSYSLSGSNGCTLENIGVDIEVKHQGGSPLCIGEAIELQYEVTYDDGTNPPVVTMQVVEYYVTSSVFESGQSFTYSFSQLIDMSLTGVYNVTAKVNYYFEGNPTNDETPVMQRINYGTPQDLMLTGLADGYCDSNGQIFVGGSFADAGYTYNQTLSADYGTVGGSAGAWTFDFPAPPFSGTITFTYEVEITDEGLGCSSMVQESILVSSPSASSLFVDEYVTYEDLVSNTVLLDAGYNAGYSYNWMPNGETTPFVIPNSFGEYTVAITEDYCTIFESVWVYQNQEIELRQGWGMWSTLIDEVSVQASSTSIEDVVLEGGVAIERVVIMKDEDGLVWWPAQSLSQIGNIENGKAYQYKMNSADTLIVSGLPVNPASTMVQLDLGHNIVGYLRQTPSAVAAELNSIIANVDIFKDEDGNVFWPAFNIDNIGNLVADKGYKIKVNAPNLMWYYSANGLSNTAKSDIVFENQYYIQNTITNDNMTLGIPANAWTNTPEIGDEVGVFNANGLIVGASVYDGNNMAIAIIGDDNLTSETEGLVVNETFTIKVWNQMNGSEVACKVNAWEMGSDNFAVDGISVVKSLDYSNSISDDQVVLYQNMPNPFSQTTQIKFNLPETSNVSITMYNVLGKVVKEVVSGTMGAGEHTVNVSAQDLASGTYFYKFETENYTETKYMSIEK